MDVVLWILQILLAMAFGTTGTLKLTQRHEWLAARVEWVKHYPLPFIRAVGLLEVLGALGLIFPMLTNILPWLTPLAALCFVMDMIVAAWVHLRLKEYSLIVLNFTLLTLAVIIVYGRFVGFPA